MEQTMKSLTLDFCGQGKHKIAPEKFFEMENGFLLDVRSREEAGSLSIKLQYHPNVEVVNIPMDEVPDRMGEIPKDKSVGVFCPAGFRSAIVYAYLLSKGFPDVRMIEGGYAALTGALMPGQVLKAVKR